MGSNHKEKRGAGWFARVGGMIRRAVQAIPALLKLGKAGGTFWSMVITVVVYTLIFPWTFSLGLVVMIFIHEMGHVWAAKRKRLPVSAPAFIPFVGALITLKKQPQDAATEAYVALGGPVVGTIGAFACYLLYLWSGLDVLLPISLIGFILNLFNLLPIHPLDGGRIVTAISRWFWAAGLAAGLFLILYTFNILLVLIWLLFAYQLWDTYFPRKRQKVRTLQATARFGRERFDHMGVWIPGEKHERELEFVQYCTLRNREHWCDIVYPGVGIIHRLHDFTGRFKGVRLMETRVEEEETGPSVHMELQLTYVPGEEEGFLRKDEAYYNVKARTRFGYGLVYFGLGAFLLYMVFQLTGFSLAGPAVVS
ncbi:site-2 protease family protein [Desmospora profundinema]|uniref:Zn-dependent protease n=1 Tax=Desmospora profundinema TaxID=1571184 RepID=A0ABU1IQB9_9BACL|nr:site-2 protease family protein [Desmospora profundinema]MDR6227006.1 Zn-dependent protease [Desmospora profundinema]